MGYENTKAKNPTAAEAEFHPAIRFLHERKTVEKSRKRRKSNSFPSYSKRKLKIKQWHLLHHFVSCALNLMYRAVIVGDDGILRKEKHHILVPRPSCNHLAVAAVALFLVVVVTLCPGNYFFFSS